MRPLARLALSFALLGAALPASAQTLDHIRETGEIRLGIRSDAAPLSYVDAEGRPSGYTPTVCAHVAELIAIDLELENLNANFVPVEAEDRFEKVANGDIDLLCGAATITIERRETVDFSIPTFVDGAAVLLPVGSGTDFSALVSKKVGVRAGTTTEEILANSLEAAGVQAEIVAFDTHDAGLAGLENGEISAYFGDQSILYELFHKSDLSENFTMSDNTLTIEKQGLALRRGDADFRLVVDRALSQLYASGTMREIFQGAFPGATPGLALKALYLIAPDLP
ncbi:MAG: amino acid ABC transporter substrate-binding protein [Rhodobacteraceae bacterium]|nr:amino acid ABC transporter substrate-binding protein [Paracoccaceae bacterium]